MPTCTVSHFYAISVFVVMFIQLQSRSVTYFEMCFHDTYSMFCMYFFKVICIEQNIRLMGTTSPFVLPVCLLSDVNLSSQATDVGSSGSFRNRTQFDTAVLNMFR